VQPLVALIGIVMGSSVALLAGLVMTLLVFLLLPEFHERLAGEFRPLLQAIAWAALLTGASVAAFIGQLRNRSWRLPAKLALVAAVLLVGWSYWPS
jgi:MFS superfamily sulfate permease-like transporter